MTGSVERIQSLKSAYLHVWVIHPPHWQFLWFPVRNTEGELIVISGQFSHLGLATAPRVFTKLLAPVAAHLHLQ